jgi:hemolysin-activating ACP:hemolysin acyltransferase
MLQTLLRTAFAPAATSSKEEPIALSRVLRQSDLDALQDGVAPEARITLASLAVPLGADQVVVFRRAGRPVGLVVWGCLSNAASRAFAAGATALADEDWASGPNPWLVMVLAPHGDGPEIVRAMRGTTFAEMKRQAIENGAAETVAIRWRGLGVN